MKLGVLALQGAFREHREVFDALGVECVEVRVPEHLGGIDALGASGGRIHHDDAPARDVGAAGTVDGSRSRRNAGLGTCAGLILLADTVLDGRADQVPLGLLDVVVRRNGYGRQRDSFEAPLAVTGVTGPVFPGVFIRAPVVEAVGAEVEVLAEHNGAPVLVRDDEVWGATFHPELSGDLRVHQLFLRGVSE